MGVHWHHQRRDGAAGHQGYKLNFWINTAGAMVTAAALVVIVVAKFAEGAWITVLVIPCVIVLLMTIRAYYDRVAAQVRNPSVLKLDNVAPPIILVVMEDWNRLTDRALCLALSLSPDVIGIHLTQLAGPEAEEQDRTLKARWASDVETPARAAGLTPPRLMILQAQYRALHEPILKLVQQLEEKFDRRRFAVLIPELVKQHWYQHILHSHRARQLRSQLLSRGSPLTVINVPWYLDDV
jgi:hypothetical protein